MVRVGGSHHLNILRSRGTKCQIRARAIHPQILLLGSLRIPIQTLMHGSKNFFQPGIFSLFFYIFASKLQTYVTFITAKYPETKSHSAKAFVEPTHFLAYFFTFQMTPLRMFLMMDGWGRFVIAQNASPYCYLMILRARERAKSDKWVVGHPDTKDTRWAKHMERQHSLSLLGHDDTKDTRWAKYMERQHL